MGGRIQQTAAQRTGKDIGGLIALAWVVLRRPQVKHQCA
jgi:hypothetical protein